MTLKKRLYILTRHHELVTDSFFFVTEKIWQLHGADSDSDTGCQLSLRVQCCLAAGGALRSAAKGAGALEASLWLAGGAAHPRSARAPLAAPAAGHAAAERLAARWR